MPSVTQMCSCPLQNVLLPRAQPSAYITNCIPSHQSRTLSCILPFPDYSFLISFERSPESFFSQKSSKAQSLDLYSIHTHFLSDLIQPLALDLDTISMPTAPTFQTPAQNFPLTSRLYIQQLAPPADFSLVTVMGI